ncbi:MAG: isochorismatase family protein [Desulfatiglandales bacterium]
MEKEALILVDLQADFTQVKKGNLAVPGTDEVYLRLVEEGLRRASMRGLLIFATQDWHPPNHISFYTNHPDKRAFDILQLGGREQILWPPHCIQGTEGARILVDNNLFMAIVQKGRDPKYDSYSGFRDDGGKETELEAILRYHQIERVAIFGLALDYCVKATALDAKDLGFAVTVVKGLSKGVSPETTLEALKTMERAGIQIREGIGF